MCEYTPPPPSSALATALAREMCELQFQLVCRVKDEIWQPRDLG